MARPKRQFTKGDELNQLESNAIAEYKSIMGEMTDLKAVIGLNHLFNESIPMFLLKETLEHCCV